MYTENDQAMHDLYERAQGGQLYLGVLDQLTDEELFYLAGHDPMSYFEVDGPTPADRAVQRERRSKLIHNARRAQLLLERRWADERDRANRLLLEQSANIANRSADIADRSRWLAGALVASTIALVLVTIVLTIATF